MICVFGKKIGMTRFFKDSGKHVGVTIIFLYDGIIYRKLTESCYKVGFCHKFRRNLKNSEIGEVKYISFCKKKLFSIDFFNNTFSRSLSVGEQFNYYSYFEPGTFVKVTGKTKGKGFSGVIKKYNFKCQPASHGNSLSHRAPGSIGQRQSPGKVFKGKKMSGHYGNTFLTKKNIEIIYINKKYNVMLVKGSIPGSINTFVKIKK